MLDAKAGHRDRSRDDEDGESRPSRSHRAPRPLGFTDSRSGLIARLTDVFQFEERDHRANQGDFVEGVIRSAGKGKAGVHVVFVKKDDDRESGKHLVALFGFVLE